MPFLCCGSKAVQTPENELLDVSKRGKYAIAKEEEAPDDQAAKEKEERALAESVYHDARTALTESMMYQPAKSMISRMELDLDNQPQFLLKSHNVCGIRDSAAVVKQDLEKSQEAVTQAGYPGELTQKELEACLEFRAQIKMKREEGQPTYYEMVHVLDGLEDEAFALCRIMRARKFVVEDVFKLLDESLEVWAEGRANKFYHELPCPLSLVHSQFPLLQYGIAQNGSLVFYVQVSKISLEAIECFTDVENLVPYIWNLLTHAFKKYAAQLQEKHPNTTILAELTVIIDLKGIQRSLFTDKVMQVLKKTVGVLNCFPEFLSKAMIINAPYFFSVIWMVFRQLMDARTTAKVDIYSGEKAGIACMKRYIDDKELLSNYGGKGASSEDVLHQLRREGRTRQMVERLFLDSKKEASCEFDLASNEKATVLIFTRSTAGVSFALSKDGDTTINKMEVKPTDGDKAHPYTRELASNIVGPGHFKVSANSNSNTKDHFLVQVCVYAA